MPFALPAGARVVRASETTGRKIMEALLTEALQVLAQGIGEYAREPIGKICDDPACTVSFLAMAVEFPAAGSGAWVCALGVEHAGGAAGRSIVMRGHTDPARMDAAAARAAVAALWEEDRARRVAIVKALGERQARGAMAPKN